MGHQLKTRLIPDPLASGKPAVWLPSRLAGSQLEHQIVTVLVDEIMQDTALARRVWYVPSGVERELNEAAHYANVHPLATCDTGAADVGCACAQVATRFVVRVVEQLVEQVSVSIMDLDASISLVPKGAGPAGPPPSE